MSKSTVVKTFFGDRAVIFVKLPIDWSGWNVSEQLYWAKTFSVVSLYDSFIVKCLVKPHYVKHFVKDNEQYIVKHSYNPKSETFDVGDTIYE